MLSFALSFPVLLLATSALFAATDQAKPDPPLPWDRWLDQTADQPGSAPAREALVKRAQETAKKPIFERVYKLEDVGKKGRTSLDGRYRNGLPEVQEIFALSMSDCLASGQLLDELPPLAAGYRLSRDPALLDRCLRQLREVSTWSPLQRPGWTLFSPGARLFKDPKGDGNWLATGNCILAITETLQMLPPEAVPTDLREKLDALLAAEIASCVDDWNAKRPWFYRWQNPMTNQWVLPTAGYLVACSHLGREKHRDAYELGVANLKLTLDAYGAEGAQVEGLGYGSMTVGILFRAARWLAASGDDRLLSHPFFKNFPTWLVHHMQPGGYSINAFDQGGGPRVALRDGKRAAGISVLLGLCSTTGSPDARWAAHRAVAGTPGEWGWFLAQGTAAPPADYAPPLWHAYDRTRRVNWRSSWDDAAASGVWVRACHPDDQHSHSDHGHVNFIHRGRAIFVEAGACLYHCPVGRSHFASAFGHNVVYLGTLTPAEADEKNLKDYPAGFPAARGNVPLTVARLDAAGGDVTVEPTTSYKDALKRWTRRVTWNIDELTTRDLVEPADAQIINLRWHLGTIDAPSITGDGKAWKITWPDAEISITADVPLSVTSEPMSDNTLGTRGPDENAMYPTHACLIVRTVDPQTRTNIETRARGTSTDAPRQETKP